MAAGEKAPAIQSWAGFILPSFVMSMALVITLSLPGTLAPPKPGTASEQPLTARAARPHFLARRTVTSPGWWKGGSCDQANYPGSHPLGAVWHGLVACGPGPTQGGSDHLVSFFPGAWGELEWECVELSMRWMYLAWGVNPYPANGWDVVRDYDYGNNKAIYNRNGPDLLVVNNGTLGSVPQPGDVVSVARTNANPYGHTAVVTASAVDARGDGTVTVIQQNGGAGNDGWASYPVSDWVVGGGVSGWLHDPAYNFQRPVIGYSGQAGFTARIAAPGNSYELLTTGAGPIAVAGDAGAAGTNGKAVYGYVGANGDFFVRRASSANWTLVATGASSIALGLTSSGTPVLAYLDDAGDFYAREGPLSGGPFTLEATGASEMALSVGAGLLPPLLGYVSKGALFVKSGVVAGSWSVEQASGVRSFALAEGPSASSSLLGYLSSSGTFFARLLGAPQWTKEAGGVSAISLAELGPGGEPLLGYLSQGNFYAAQSVASPHFLQLATQASAIAVVSGPAPGALPLLGYLSTSGDLEILQGPLTGAFSLQASGVSSFALSSVTDS